MAGWRDAPEDWIEAALRFAPLLASVVRGHQVLAAVLDPLNGPAEPPRRPRDQEVLRVELAAHAEAAAHLQLGELDEVLGIVEEIGQDPPVEVGNLGYAPEAQHPRARIELSG